MWNPQKQDTFFQKPLGQQSCKNRFKEDFHINYSATINIDVRKRDAPAARKTVSESHMCYLQKESAKKCNEKLIFFDFETDQTTGEHVVNFAVAQYLDGTEFVCRATMQLINFANISFLHSSIRDSAIAHNMKGVRWTVYSSMDVGTRSMPSSHSQWLKE
ncbi:hypothetical protein TNCV_1412411 [Trichonephila clavipes]|nr:hypothetical protein TNCV_1412411 [Trichonephila clavipes]